MHRVRCLASALLIASLACLIDQLTKWSIMQRFYPGEIESIFPGFNLRLAFNHGVAFSLFNQGGSLPVFLTLLSLIITIGLLIWLYRIASTQKGKAFALSLIIGGAIGNVIDRIRLGYVIDFLDFYVFNWHWPTFNMADTWICLGAFILIFYLYKEPS